MWVVFFVVVADAQDRASVEVPGSGHAFFDLAEADWAGSRGQRRGSGYQGLQVLRVTCLYLVVVFVVFVYLRGLMLGCLFVFRRGCAVLVLVWGGGGGFLLCDRMQLCAGI